MRVILKKEISIQFCFGVSKMNNRIQDNYGRYFRKLRISILDTCNYACSYCMPDNPEFQKIQTSLNADEIFNIVKNLVPKGLEHVRITGGEPTLHPKLVQIVQAVKAAGASRIGMTTNGEKLFPLLKHLSQAGLDNLNFSLDSLNEEKFSKITKRGNLSNVLKAILEAKHTYKMEVKINTVLMKGVNDDEVLDFIHFAKENDIEVRFLEAMKIGVMVDQYDDQFISSSDTIKMIRSKMDLELLNSEFDSTSRNYLTSTGARIGFISSESSPFCTSCSRLRLDSKGKMRACLMANEGINIRGVSEEHYDDILQKLINQKPIERIESLDQPMYQVGG